MTERSPPQILSLKDELILKISLCNSSASFWLYDLIPASADILTNNL